MQRILVAGQPGCGKTWLARDLSRGLGVPHIELDALHWGPGWTPCPPPLFRQRVAEALAGEAWVADGDYGKVRDITWERADTLVWLDYPLPLILWRLLTRTLYRITTAQELWNGNRETWREAFWGEDNLLVYLLKGRARHRALYREAMRGLGRRPVIVRLRTPREARRWLASWIAQASGVS